MICGCNVCGRGCIVVSETACKCKMYVRWYYTTTPPPLAVAVTLSQGAAAFGVTGTGKSETCREISRTLGRPCLAVNCGDTWSLPAITHVLRGVCQTPTWAVLDEFNRFTQVVQSTVAVWLGTIQGGIRGGVEEVGLAGERVKLCRNCAVCVTMNPGYAGRVELPSNL